LSLFEFQDRFPDENSCVSYLASLKWKDGYRCKKYGHNHDCQAIGKHDRQYSDCNRLESPMSETAFHQCKFSILKAFYIVYYVSTSKSGFISTELSRKLELRQKTWWLFKQKMMRAMSSSGNIPMSGKLDVDETFVGGQDEVAIVCNEGKKQILLVAVERKGKGVPRIYGRVVENDARKHLNQFMLDHISPNTLVRTYKWTGYKGLESEYPILV